MPGHKNSGEFAKLFPVAGLDVTELSWSDNLSCPQGVIEGAQSDIAKILGAHRSYILTNGSTCGVMTMLYAAFKRGSKVIVPRNSHQSVWNACRIFGLEPVIVQGEVSEGIILPPDPEEVAQLIADDVTISAMIVTSPDYYGNIAPLERYAQILKAKNRLLLVDGAHGGHLAFEPQRAGYAGVYADAWVDGAHKTLFTLTQGAILNVNNPDLSDDIEEGLGIFRTTSPSYPVMASVEYGVKALANSPQILQRAKSAAAKLKQTPGLTFYPSGDWTKALLDCLPLDKSAVAVAQKLEKKNIYCEFADERYVLFYLSPATCDKDIKKLTGAVKWALGDKKLPPCKPRVFARPQPRTYSYGYALNHAAEWVPLDEAVGRMCAANAGLTPPCIPVCAAGEIVTKSAVSALKSGTAFGLKDGKIKVIK